MFVKKGVLILILLLGIVCGRAEEKKPCLVFQREGKENLAVDLDKYNRIQFGSESMMLSNSENSANTLEILYSVYNQFKIEDSVPSASAVEDVVEDVANLFYNPAEQTLVLLSDSEEAFDVGVFNLSGMLELNTRLKGGDTLSLKSLCKGIYVVVAVGETKTFTFKLIK